MAQEITGSNPVARPSKHPSGPLDAPVAQRIEYWASNPGVAGSNPARRAISSLLKAYVSRLVLSFWQLSYKIKSGYQFGDRIGFIR